jgi:hypothetical protein
MGSSSEEYLLLLAHDLGYLSHIHLNNGLVEIRKMLHAFIQKLKSSRECQKLTPKANR